MSSLERRTTPERPTTPVRHADMTRDERIEAQVYRGIGWNAIPDDEVLALIRTMRQRCEPVIKANGLHTRF